MTHRMTTPFALWDSYRPKDVCESKRGVLGCSKKFSRLIWNPRCCHVHTILLILSSFNWVSNLKNDHGLAFSSLKNEWEVVRPSRLLWEIAMDLRMSAKTNYGCSEALENFLRPLKAPRFVPQRAIFEAFWGKCALRDYQTQKITRCSRLRP